MTEYVDAGTVYLKLTPSSVETTQFVDSGTVYLDLTASGTEVRTVLAPSFTSDASPKWQVETPPSNRFLIVNEDSAKKYLVSFSGKAPNVPNS